MRFGKTTLAVLMVLSVVLCTGQQALAQEDLKTKLMTIERELWKAWKQGNLEPFKERLPEDAISITPGGMTLGKANVLKELSEGDCEVRSFKLSDAILHTGGKQFAILTYKAKQKATCGDVELPEDLYVSATYVKRKGKWMMWAYHETAVVE